MRIQSYELDDLLKTLQIWRVYEIYILEIKILF